MALRRVDGVLLAAAVLLSAGRHTQAQQRRNAAALLMDEIAHAQQAVKWRGSALSDETRLAIAASGVSWQPGIEGIALLRADRKGMAYGEASDRARGFLRARDGHNDRIAIPFALSIVLDPRGPDSRIWRDAFDYLAGYGSEFDDMLIGILQAPDKLPLLPEYDYAAADVLVYRASPRLMPVFLNLAETSDRYLRSRAIVGLGVAAYRSAQGRPASIGGLLVTLHEGSVSAVQQAMVTEALRRAVDDKSYHVRAAAALALGLAGDDADLPLLEKLAKDRAYLLVATDRKDEKRVFFPVRDEAARALARFGRSVESGSGTFRGKEFSRAVRGGNNVTSDTGDMRKDRVSHVRFCDGDW